LRLGLVLALAAMSVAACASDSTQVLHGLKALPILRQAPPGGVEIGSAQDHGTIAGDQTGITVVYASNRPAAELDEYYRTRYPAYSLVHDNSVDLGPARPAYAEIGSSRVGNVEATVAVRIQTNSPDLTEQGLNYNLKLRRAPAGATTFVTVNVIGFVPTHPKSS
jgi:hypothetical protein